ncbi:hypothetical protein FOA52_008190 [Chlamydomonas sp. UWO 241]|nr:hypothetical protein FOA52_008190 [Chlamydomonas sp. UWO 241]
MMRARRPLRSTIPVVPPTTRLPVAIVRPSGAHVPSSRHERLRAPNGAPPATGALRSRVATRAAAGVVAHANLFARASRIVRSFIEGLVSSAEDPEKLLDTIMVEMNGDLVRMRQAGAQVLASQKTLEARYRSAQAAADDWMRRAELAVTKGADELAKEALQRRRAQQTQADSLKTQVELQQMAVDQLMANTRALKIQLEEKAVEKAVGQVLENTRILESKLGEARSKKDTLKARAASAKTSQQIAEMVGNLRSTSAMGNAVAAFEKMEERVLAMEAQAESTALLGPGGDELSNKFALLEAGTLDDDLVLLKRTMALPSPPPRMRAPVEMLPQKTATRLSDLDLEVEDLRMRMEAVGPSVVEELRTRLR